MKAFACATGRRFAGRVASFAHPVVIGIAVLLAALPLASAADAELHRLELEWGQSINLADFGGPDIEVFVRNREMTYVTAAIADFTRMVAVARTTIYGDSSIEMLPVRQTRQVEKKNGAPFPGTNSAMYLLYREPQSGIRVFFLDQIARQNHDWVVVATPLRAPYPEAPRPARPPPVPYLSPAARALEAGQPLTPELFAEYVALQEARAVLDVNDPEAVARFNRRAAAYHQALRKARATIGN